MRFLGYIKGDGRGSASREIERRSLYDPFLSDAIDGYEHQAGRGAEHIRSIAELERDINRRRTLVPKKQWPVFLYMCILLIILSAVIVAYLAM